MTNDSLCTCKRYQAAADIVVTLGFTVLMGDTGAGLAAGIMGGLLFSVMIAAAGKVVPAEKAEIYKPHGARHWYQYSIRWYPVMASGKSKTKTKSQYAI